MANSYDIKLPAIKATTLQGKIEEMQSYIYQMVGQLNWALNTIESSGGKDSDTYNELKKVSVSLSENSNAVDGETPQETFDRIKALIIKSADIVEAYEQKMELDFDGKYVAESDFGTFKEETNTKIALADAGIAVHTEQIQTINNSMSAMDEVVKKNTTDIKTNADAIKLKADTSTTDALGNRLSNAEGELSVQAGKIDAKVSKTDGSSTSSAQWSIDAVNGVVIDTHGTDKGFTVKSNGETVLEVDKDGLTVNGSGTFSGTIEGAVLGASKGSTLTVNATLQSEALTLKGTDGVLINGVTYFTNDVNLDSDLAVNLNADIGGDLWVGDDLDVKGNTGLDGNLRVDGETDLYNGLYLHCDLSSEGDIEALDGHIHGKELIEGGTSLEDKYALISNGIGETAGGRNLANFHSISASDGGYPFRFINPSEFVIENQSTSTIYPRMGDIYLEAGTYTLSAVGLTNTIYIEFYDEGLVYDKSIGTSNPSYTFTITSPKTLFLMGVIGAGKRAYTVQIMLEKGATAHSYEPYYMSNRQLSTTQHIVLANSSSTNRLILSVCGNICVLFTEENFLVSRISSVSIPTEYRPKYSVQAVCNSRNSSYQDSAGYVKVNTDGTILVPTNSFVNFCVMWMI